MTSIRFSKLFLCAGLFTPLAFANSCAPHEMSIDWNGWSRGTTLLQSNSRVFSASAAIDVTTSRSHTAILSSGSDLNGSAEVLADDPSTPWISYPHWDETNWTTVARKSAQAAAHAAQGRGSFQVFFVKFHKVGSTTMSGLLNRCSGVTLHCGLSCGGRCQPWEKPTGCTGHISLNIFKKYIENFPPRLRNLSAPSSWQNIERALRDSRLYSITSGVREVYPQGNLMQKIPDPQNQKTVNLAWARHREVQRMKDSDLRFSESIEKDFQQNHLASELAAKNQLDIRPVKLLVATLLRNPLERLRSKFYFRKAQNCFGQRHCPEASSSFSDWMKRREHWNEYAVYLGSGSSEMAKIALATQFDIVGITERFDESIVELSRLLQVPYKELMYRRERKNSKNKHPWTEEERAIAKERLEADLDIYQFADKLSTVRLVSGAWKNSSMLQKAVESYRSVIVDLQQAPF